MKNYKIIDTFLFNGEFEMLKMRLDYYYDSVDYFIICESNYTQNGTPKNLTYPGNEYLFDEYKDKLHYIVYVPEQEDIDKVKENSFQLEKKHIDFIRDYAVKLSDENTVTMLSGVDEFPDKNRFDEMWSRIKEMNMDAISYKMRTFYYSPICELKIDCFGTTVVNDYTLRLIDRLSSLRDYTFNCPHIEDGGWHLSFFHTPEIIKKKIESYAHSEFNLPDITNLENIKQRMYNCLDVLNRPEIKIIKHEKINDFFPIEFFRHDIFFRNVFDRQVLKPWVKKRRDNAMQIPLEIENLQLAVNNYKSKVVVEIGTANGGTLSRWFELPMVETIVSIDYPHGIHGGQGFEERTYVISDAMEQANRSKKEFYAINGDSKNQYLIDRLEEILQGRKIDFLFIDGDHTYNGVKNDFLLYEKFLGENSIVGFHDIIDSEFHREHNCYVSKFWDELNNSYETEKFIYTHTFDRKITDYIYDISNNKGGFGGIGIMKYSKDKKKQNLSLLIPVYNNVDLTIENINKTLETSKRIDDIVIYSNGTKEEENKKLFEYSKENPIVRVYTNEKPIGFIKAVNEGLKLCKNELTMCINSDAHLFANWEDRLIPLCEKENNGLIGPILQDDFILGCCFITKKSILNKIGLLNEGFGMGYYDDNELTDRVLRNGYDLGYGATIQGWGPENRAIDFPLNHIQGVTFLQVDYEKTKIESEQNKLKLYKFKDSKHVKVLKNMNYSDVKNILNEEDVFIVINKSGEEFEKIRYDKDIIRLSHIFECTNEMDINVLIDSITKGKSYEIVNPTKKDGLSWLAKFDDYASMGILSQRVIEKLNTDVSCEPIIGETNTKNKLILDSIKKPKNHNLGIMFAYPDMYPVLNEYKTKVIYTGVDSTGGIPNFAENSNKADFLLTPSNKSKERMEKLGVKKPIFVFPHGVDPEVFKYTDRIKSEVFKFLYVGECSDRKGIFQLLEAFISEFKDNKNVELHIKSNNDMLFYNGDKVTEIVNSHSNIFWHTDNQGHDYILELYKSSHVYVYPSRADTFGMTLLEAMACGLPIISTGEPGATELIEGKYYHVLSKDVPVKNHPWMLGEWGEANVESLKKQMEYVYRNYIEIISSGDLKKHSEYIVENFSWDKVTQKFENEILPNFYKKDKILTLVTSFNRPHHISNVIDSLKNIREDNVDNFIYIIENSNPEIKESVVGLINSKIDDNFRLYNSEFNMGQRGSLLQMLEDVNIDDYDFVQFTDQDNIFNEPLSTYCDVLRENPDTFFVTGYMSKEHGELGWKKTKYGNLCEKMSCRAGHMFMRTTDLKSLFPIHLDSQYGEPHNSSWNAGLDWELQWWNPKSPGKLGKKNFVLCVPGGVLHKGVDSTMYEWDVEGNEYKLEELSLLRSEGPTALQVFE